MIGSDPSCELLLLNASNYARVPIFPYAFVQVSEIARRHGIRVRFHDLLGTPEEEVKPTLARLLRLHRPRAIGLHLRQTDSLLVEDYRRYEGDDAPASALASASSRGGGFFPVRETGRVIGHLREMTSAPVLVGGHGYSSNPRGLFEVLGPDLGLVGEPDAMFARFEDVIAGRDLASIPNLVWRDGGRATVNPRAFFPPAQGPEYSDEIVDAIKRFYGERFLEGQTFPVEVMRGCPYRCYFCVEPGVKGREARVRDLEAVMADVEFLAWRGLFRIWFVCSELNVFGPDLALELGRRITKVAERVGHPIHWYAFSLPSRMSEATWRSLVQSGFRGGFNTFMSLDDENLRKGRIPHRAEDAVREYEIIEKLADELGPAVAQDFRSRGTLALFFGNAYATVATVSRSLSLLHRHGLLETARVPLVMTATRVFEVTGALDAGSGEGNVRCSFDELGVAETEVSRLPSFEYPTALLEHFGGRKAMDRFFHWVQTTILSRQHEGTKDWPLFLANASTPAEMLARLEARRRSGAAGPSGLAKALVPEGLHATLSTLLLSPAEDAVRELFFPAPDRREAAGKVALGAIVDLLEGAPVATAFALRRLGLPDDLRTALEAPVYDFLEPLYDRFASVEEAVATAAGSDDDAPTPAAMAALAALAARFVLYKRNVVIEPAYRRALFLDRERESAAVSRVKRLPVHAA